MCGCRLGHAIQSVPINGFNGVDLSLPSRLLHYLPRSPFNTLIYGTQHMIDRSRIFLHNLSVLRFFL